jgi:hypothetical protein
MPKRQSRIETPLAIAAIRTDESCRRLLSPIIIFRTELECFVAGSLLPAGKIRGFAKCCA